MRQKNQNVSVENEIIKLEEQFSSHQKNIDDLKDQQFSLPSKEIAPQTEIAQKDIRNSKDIYLKPENVIFSKEKFNEKFRDQWNFSKEYVQFIAENIECKGNVIEKWTKEFPGTPCEFWVVPVNKPVWGPRYLAESITRMKYQTLRMDEELSAGRDSVSEYYGQLVYEDVKHRANAMPALNKKQSVFMGSYQK